MDVVMRAGDVEEGIERCWGKYHAGLEPRCPNFRNEKCWARFPRDGNFIVEPNEHNGGWQSNHHFYCDTPYQHGVPEVASYRLQRDGNFVATCGDQVVYATHTNQGEGDYFMAMDDNCILHIQYKGTCDCDSVDTEEEIRSNIKLEPLKPGDRLGPGDYVLDKEINTKLTLQTTDATSSSISLPTNILEMPMPNGRQTMSGTNLPDFREEFCMTSF